MKVKNMTIELPHEWRKLFHMYTKAEAMLRYRYRTTGVSPATILKTFAAFSGSGAIWREPSFLVWAGLRGCCTSQDFIKRWDGHKRTIAEEDAALDELERQFTDAEILGRSGEP